MANEEKIAYQDIPYTLTMFVGDKAISTVPLPNNPSKVTWSEDFPTTVEYTLGDIPKREHNKPKRWTVELSGRTGVATRIAKDGKEKRPLTVLSEFIAFLEEYQRQAAATGATALRRTGSNRDLYASTYLAFHAFKEDIHLMVDVVSFSFDRDAATTRHSASWSISLLGWRKISMMGVDTSRYSAVPNYAAQYVSPQENELAQGWTSADPEALARARILTPGVLREFNDAALELYKRGASARLDSLRTLAANMPKGTGGACGVFASALSQVNGAINTANAGISQVAGVATKIQTYGLAFQRTVTDFRNMLRSGIDILHMPQRILSDLANTTAVLRESFYDLYYAFEYVKGGLGIKDAWSMLLLSASAHEDAVVMVGSSGAKVKNLTYATDWSTKTLPLSSAQETAFGSVYSVPQGAYSWSDISTAVYGEPTYWVVLAKFNGAYDGYSDSAGKPLQPGTLIYLPAPAGNLMTGKKPNADDFYLTDFLLDETGDISLTTGAYLTNGGQVTDNSSSGDLQTVTGFANLIQAMTTLLGTPQGALSDYPTYGLLGVTPGDSLT